MRFAGAALSCVLWMWASQSAEAAVVVPAVPEPIAAVSMGCAPAAGIDVNKATVSELMSLPGVSKPVAQRIVESRPYLRVDPDLLRVAGIGADKLALIVANGRACATPPSIPPPTFDVCQTGDGKVDANRPQSEKALAALFGGPTAKRIANAIPYWSLNQVRSEGEAGAGYGKMEKLMGRLCLTPPTIVYAGTRYGWIDPDRGGYVNSSTGDGTAYRLTVPGGVVTQRPGAWGAVTPRPTPADLPEGAPTADFHIHGTWSGTVYVGLPPDGIGPESAGTWTDTVWHLPADGQWELSWGGAVARIDGRVTTGTQTLSFLTSLRQKASQFGAWVGETAVKVATWAENTIRQFLGTGASPPNCNPGASEGRQGDGAYLATFGQLLVNRPLTPPLWRCIERRDEDTAKWEFVLNRGVSLFAHADPPAQGRARVTELRPTGDLLVDAVAIGWTQLLKNSGISLLWPATAEMGVELESGAGSGNLFIGGPGPMAGATLIVQGLKEASGLLPGGLGPLYTVLSTCLWNGGPQVANTLSALQNGPPSAVYDGLLGVFNATWDCVTDHATGAAQERLLDNDLTSPLKAVSKFGRVLLLIKLATYGSIVADGISLGMVEDNDVRMQFNAPPPPLPTGVNDGGLPNGAASLPGNVLLKEPAPSVKSYWRDVNRAAHHITTGADYICLAGFFPTWYGVDSGEFAHAVDSSAGDLPACPLVFAPRELSKDTWRNVLLRDADSRAWWYVRHDGVLVALNDGVDGPTCRFDDLLVWDWVTDDELQAFGQDPNELERTMC
jgi:hypothetical protein